MESVRTFRGLIGGVRRFFSAISKQPIIREQSYKHSRASDHSVEEFDIESPIIVFTEQKLNIDVPKVTSDRQNAYTVEASGDYLTFLLLQPSKQEFSPTTLEKLLKETDEKTRLKIRSKIELLFKYRIILNELAIGVDLLPHEEIVKRLSPTQKENIKKEFEVFTNLLIGASMNMSTQTLVELVTYMVHSRLNSHVLWRSLMPRIISNISEITTDQLSDLMDSMYQIFLRYDRIEGATRVRSIPVLDEYLLQDILTVHNIKDLIMHMHNTIQAAPSVMDLVRPLKRLLLIMKKFLKISSINSPLKNFFLDKLSLAMYKEYPLISSMTQEELRRLYVICGHILGLGRNNQLVLKTFFACIRYYKSTEMISNARMVFFAINALMTNCDFNQEIWEGYHRPMIMEFLRVSKGVLELKLYLTYLSFAVRLNMRDDELYSQLFEKINEIIPNWESFKSTHMIQTKYIHTIINYGLEKELFAAELLPKIQRLANYGSSLCICYQHQRYLDKEPQAALPESIPKRGNLAFLNCIVNEPSRNYVLSQNPIRSSIGIQYYEDNYNEKLIKEAVVNNVLNFFAKPLRYSEDLADIQVCQYRWDAVFTSEEVPQKIGLEITGEAYRSLNQNMISKKAMKFEILVKSNYIPVIFDVNTPTHKSVIKLAYTDLLAAHLALCIVEQVRETTGIEMTLKPGEKERIEAMVLESKNRPVYQAKVK